jgi:hypothetical protein
MSREGSRTKGGRCRCRHDGTRARATSARARTTRWARSPAGAEAVRRARRGGRRTSRGWRRGGGCLAVAALNLALRGGEDLLALTRSPAAEEARLPPWPPTEGRAGGRVERAEHGEERRQQRGGGGKKTTTTEERSRQRGKGEGKRKVVGPTPDTWGPLPRHPKPPSKPARDQK